MSDLWIDFKNILYSSTFWKVNWSVTDGDATILFILDMLVEKVQVLEAGNEWFDQFSSTSPTKIKRSNISSNDKTNTSPTWEQQISLTAKLSLHVKIDKSLLRY